MSARPSSSSCALVRVCELHIHDASILRQCGWTLMCAVFRYARLVPLRNYKEKGKAITRARTREIDRGSETARGETQQ